MLSKPRLSQDPLNVQKSSFIFYFFIDRLHSCRSSWYEVDGSPQSGLHTPAILTARFVSAVLAFVGGAEVILNLATRKEADSHF